VLRLAIPSAGETMLHMLVMLVITYLVGHLGPASLAAVGLSWQISLTVMILFTAVGTGATALIARMVGAQDWVGANRVVRQAFLVAFGAGLAATLLFVCFAEPLLVLMGAEGDVLTQGVDFLRAVSSVFIVSAIMFIGHACMRGAGDMRTPLLITIVVNLLNVGVAWVLVNGVGPFPALGVFGAGVGSSIGRAAGGLLVFVILLRGRAGLRLQWGEGFDWSLIRRMARIGLPAAVDQVAHRLGMLVFVRTIAALGTVSFAAHQIALNAESTSFMPGWGFAIAATTLVGQGLGARDARRSERDAMLAFYIALAFMSVMGVAFIIFAPQIIEIFTEDADVIAAGSTPLRVIGLVQPLLAAMMVFSGALRGAGDTITPMLVNAGSVWLIRVPGCLLVTLWLGWGLTGVWAVMGLDLAVRGTVMFVQFRRGRWKKLIV
jgi:MATE family multidrug resistance protein